MWHWQNREPLKEREFFPFAQEALVQLPHWPDHLARCDRKWGISFEIPSFADHPSLLFTPVWMGQAHTYGMQHPQRQSARQHGQRLRTTADQWGNPAANHGNETQPALIEGETEGKPRD
jgi:hypothetical protein